MGFSFEKGGSVRSEVFFPNLFLQALSLLGFIRNLIFSLFNFLGLFDFIETDTIWLDDLTCMPEHKLVSAMLIREFLLVMKV